MNTVSHILVNTAVLAHNKDKYHKLSAAVGGFVPDIALFTMVGYERFINQQDLMTIFDDIYFNSDFWQAAFGASNSFPIYLTLILVTYLLRSKLGKYYKYILIFLLSCLLHITFDFFLHANDAYMQFWPLSTWKFESPISYWDGNYSANYWRPIEWGITLVSIFYLLNIGKYLKRIKKR